MSVFEMTYWVDRKINLILEFLRTGVDSETLLAVIEDLRICHDQVRGIKDMDLEFYRVRCNKLLACVGMTKKLGVSGLKLEYLDALEGVLLKVMCGRVDQSTGKKT